MQEMARAGDDGCVSFDAAPNEGEWITKQGADIQRDAVILPAGTRLTPQALGLAASVGCAMLDVVRRVYVAIFFTGDERMPGEPLEPGAIYNSNRFTLRALLEKLGCEVSDLGIVPDRLDATRETLRRAALGHDLILTCGGVSVGEEDHAKPAVEAEGRIAMWQIAMKPGKPLAFGAVRRGDADHRGDSGEAFFIGLPGNLVSSFCTFCCSCGRFCCVLQVSNRSRRASTRCAPISRRRRAIAATNSCARLRARQRGRRPRAIRRSEFGRADFDRLGRRSHRQPAESRDRRGRDGAVHPFSELMR